MNARQLPPPQDPWANRSPLGQNTPPPAPTLPYGVNAPGVQAQPAPQQQAQQTHPPVHQLPQQQGSVRQLTCPRCRCAMAEVTEPASGINIDVCTNGQCAGFFFDFREFQLTMNALLCAVGMGHKQIQVPQFPGQALGLLAELFSITNFGHARASITCPRCNGQMFETNEHGVNIDTCHGCWGMFFDGGEFKIAFNHIVNQLGYQGNTGGYNTGQSYGYNPQQGAALQALLRSLGR